ncbi:hypothetical protein PIB30_029313 [Stylosanthes scabra]|uniref:Uncharacterized protein n=1 Tax=Stylosanthes scabra TaxID=79078 RepID=A0ABU6YA59_9FABA|nr:hypothetical protein [Stylosanthes scabra]
MAVPILKVKEPDLGPIMLEEEEKDAMVKVVEVLEEELSSFALDVKNKTAKPSVGAVSQWPSVITVGTKKQCCSDSDETRSDDAYASVKPCVRSLYVGGTPKRLFRHRCVRTQSFYAYSSVIRGSIFRSRTRGPGESKIVSVTAGYSWEPGLSHELQATPAPNTPSARDKGLSELQRRKSLPRAGVSDSHSICKSTTACKSVLQLSNLQHRLNYESIKLDKGYTLYVRYPRYNVGIISLSSSSSTLYVRFSHYTRVIHIIRQIPHYTWELDSNFQIWAETPRYTWRSPRITWEMNSNVQEAYFDQFNQDLSSLKSIHQSRTDLEDSRED